uniref:Uncharacterized protein n=1 Tax=Avena sativa TaxID=4498 RepID=A0ACD6A1A9_AVESA
MDIMQTSDSSHHGIVENNPYKVPYDRHVEGGQLGASWYFSRKEIEENSLSRRDGIDLKKESYLRKSYCTFLQDFGMRLKVPQVTIATAIVFCHRFFLRQSHAKNDRQIIATVCMFLAGKVEETPRPLKDVVLISYEIIHKKDPAAVARIKQKEVYEQQKELLLIGERLVLVTLGFDMNVHHPYKPLVEAIKKFKVAQNALAQVAWNFVNDGYAKITLILIKIKRRKSKVDAGRKVDVMDDDDLIERELEHGIELAAEDDKKHDRRQSWPHPAQREDHQNMVCKVENTEEGELSMDSQEYHTADPDSRKRKDVRGGDRDLKRMSWCYERVSAWNLVFPVAGALRCSFAYAEI